MAIQSNLKNMAIVLTSVCLVCSALLAITYAATSEPIRASSLKALQVSLGEVLPDGGEIAVEPRVVSVDGKDYEYYTQTTGGNVSALAVKSTVAGFGGPLTVLVGVQPGDVVYATKVLFHSETPGLGAKCQSDENFLKQFRGFDASKYKLAVGKDGGDIDAITASTITSRAYTLAVENAVKVAAELLKNSGNE